MNKAVIATVLAGLTGLAATLSVAGCSASSGDSSGSAVGLAQNAASADSAGGGAAAHAAASDAGGAAGGSAGGSAGGNAASAAEVTSLALIRTATVHVRVAKAGDVSRRADAAEAIATEAGGSVYADDRTGGKHAAARLTLKVPPEALGTVLRKLSALGTDVSRSSSTKDVTAQVADVTSRVRSARASLARLRALYGQASKVRDVIAIESEITQRESDLESLEAQQRALGSQTAFATVHLRLTAAAAAPPPAKHERGGFVGGLSHGWDAFVTTVTAVVTAFGAILPFLVVLLVAVAIAWRARSRFRRPGPSVEPTPSAGE